MSSSLGNSDRILFYALSKSATYIIAVAVYLVYGVGTLHDMSVL